MSFDDQQLNQLCDLAVQAALAAGEIIQAHRQVDVAVRTKAIDTSLAGQVVTEVDHKAQAVILEILLPSCAQFDLALLTEESPDDGARQQRPAFWCIDPMDGTLPFTQGIPGFSVSIALVARDGTPLIGVVFDPVSQTLYRGMRGQGAWRNDLPIVVPVLDRTQRLILRTDFSFEKHRWLEPTRAGLERIAAELGMPGAEIRFRTGSVLNACEILATPHICYFKYPRKTDNGGSLWDYAASACLFNELGAVATDMFGQPMELNRSGSTFMNHKGILYAGDRELADRLVAFHRTLAGLGE